VFSEQKGDSGVASRWSASSRGPTHARDRHPCPALEVQETHSTMGLERVSCVVLASVKRFSIQEELKFAHDATVSYVCVAKVKGQAALASMVDTCKVLYAMGQQAPRLVCLFPRLTVV